MRSLQETCTVWTLVGPAAACTHASCTIITEGWHGHDIRATAFDCTGFCS